MASAGSIFVDLLLKTAGFESGVNKASNASKRLTNQWRRDFGAASGSFSSLVNPIGSVTSALGQLATVAASALSVQSIIRYSDTWRQMEGRLGLVSDGMKEVVSAQQALFSISQRNRQSLQGVTDFYTRLTQFIPEAERAQYDLLGVTESVTAALAITGETGASASAAMIQFTQAIGTNFEAAGQELRSLQEQAPRLTKALMNALGDGTKSLQQLKEAGLLTRESVINALSGMGEEGQRLRDELASIPLTVSQAFTQLDNAFLRYIGLSEEIIEGTSTLALAISNLAENFDSFADSVLKVGKILVSLALPALFGKISIKVVSLAASFGTMASRLSGMVGLVVGFVVALRNLTGEVEAISRAAINMPPGITNPWGQGSQAPWTANDNTPFIPGGMSRINQTSFDPSLLINKSTRPAGKASKEAEAARKKAAREAEKQMERLGRLYEKNESYITGLDRATISYFETVEELNELLRNNKITTDEHTAAVSRLKKEFEESQGTTEKWGKELEAISKRAAENMQDAFADFLFDPFAEGAEGMLEGFSRVLRRMVAEATAAQIFEGLLGTANSNGNRSGGLLEGLGSGLAGIFDGFFANGGYIKPGHFGVAGEAGAELVYGGSSGASVTPMTMGGNVSVNIINNTSSNITQSSSKTANGVSLDVMIDEAVANRITTPGSRTNQALRNYGTQFITRR